MIPQRFAHSNIVMTAPDGMQDCDDVHAWVGKDPSKQDVCITAWRPTREELVKLNLGEPLYLWVYGGGMPPVCLTTDDPFQPTTQPED